MTDEEMNKILQDVGVPEERWERARETMKLGFMPVKCLVGNFPGSLVPFVTIEFEPVDLPDLPEI